MIYKIHQDVCFRSCENNHPCKKKCGVICGPCVVPTIKILPCDHQIKLLCHVDSELYECKEKVCLYT